MRETALNSACVCAIIALVALAIFLLFAPAPCTTPEIVKIGNAISVGTRCL